MPQSHPRPRAAVQRPLGPNACSAPHTLLSSHLPPRAAYRQARSHPVGQPHTARQPRRQRRVARPSGADTVCTEDRENPRATPFRVPLPWPPGGGLGAGGQGVPDTSQCRLEKQPTPATASQCNDAIRAPGPPSGPLGPNACSAPIRHFLRISRQGQRTDKHVPTLRGSRAQPANHAVSAASPAHRAPIQCVRKTAKSRAPRHSASCSPGPLEGA